MANMFRIICIKCPVTKFLYETMWHLHYTVDLVLMDSMFGWINFSVFLLLVLWMFFCLLAIVFFLSFLDLQLLNTPLVSSNSSFFLHMWMMVNVCLFNSVDEGGWTQVLRKGKQFLLHLWHLSCYSCYNLGDREIGFLTLQTYSKYTYYMCIIL
jgi:hypothetical protein